MTDRVKRPLAGCLACILGLALLADLAYGSGPVGRADAVALHRLAGQAGAWPGDGARLLAHLGDPLVQVALLALLVGVGIWLQRPSRTVAALALVAGANLTTQVLKAALAHPRYRPILGYDQVGETAFPSGHSTAVAAMVFAWAVVLPRSWRPAVLVLGAAVALAVGLSLVILHRHFPSDVAGGWLVASAWLCAVVTALRLGPDRLDDCPSDPA